MDRLRTTEFRGNVTYSATHSLVFISYPTFSAERAETIVPEATTATTH